MILGIDYGLKNIGLATSEGEIAEPFGVVHKFAEVKVAAEKVGAEKLVVGISEGKSRDAALAFGRKIGTVLRLPVEFVDETLTSYEAGPRAHAKAAAIILQRYLDSFPKSYV